MAIAREVDPIARTIDAVYKGVGMNTGNLMFTNAVWRQIAWTEAQSGFGFDPEEINADFDAVVIPAANWMYENFDFGQLGQLIAQVDIPVVLIGLGAQAGQAGAIPHLPSGTIQFIRAVAERSAFIGSRGPFSSDVLDHYGVRNHMPIGCPSMYFNVGGVAQIRTHPPDAIVISGTRYGPPTGSVMPEDARQQALYALAFHEKLDVIYQSERPEFDYLVAPDDATRAGVMTAAMQRYYACESAEEVASFIDAHGHCYLNVDTWISDMKSFDLYLGSRIHGAIAALLAGTPAVLLTHDARTAELADFGGIPRLSIADTDRLDRQWIREVRATADYGRYQATTAANALRYVEFLQANGLPHRFPVAAPTSNGSEQRLTRSNA